MRAVRQPRFAPGDKVKTLNSDRSMALFGTVESLANRSYLGEGAEPLYWLAIQGRPDLIARAEHNVWERHESMPIVKDAPAKARPVRPSIRANRDTDG